MTDRLKEQNKDRAQAAPGRRCTPGQTVTDKGIEFAVTIDSDKPAAIVIYRKGSEHVLQEIPLEQEGAFGSVRRVFAEGLNSQEIEYNIRIADRIEQDPCAQVIVGRAPFGSRRVRGAHQIRCGFRRPDFDWEGDTTLQIPYEDVISYSLHVRGFTRDKNSGVRDKGTFAGVAQKASYLKDLGINQIILMPCYEFEEVHGTMTAAADWMRAPENVSVPLRRYAGRTKGAGPIPAQTDQTEAADASASPADRAKDTDGTAAGAAPEKSAEEASSAAGRVPAGARVNFWGYTNGWYFAPKFSYSASGVPDTEFKEMVKTLHRAGIEVVMQMAFEPDTDISMMIDCLVSWVNEYHVDGFELMVDPQTAHFLARVPALRMTKLITGYFETDKIYPHGRGKAYRNLADKNDGFRTDCRRLLKSDENMLQAFVSRVKQNGKDKGCINYITCHDGFTLMDLVSYDRKHNEDNGEQNRDGAGTDYSWNCGAEGPTRKKNIASLRLRQMKNAMMMLLLSQGTPMLRAGDECCNSQEGNNNPWCMDNERGYVTWNRTRMAGQMGSFIRQLIRFRKEHPALHRASPLTGSDQASCGYPDFSLHGSRAWYGALDYQCRHIGMMYCGPDGRGRQELIYVAYNFHWEEQEFALPYLPEGFSWHVALDTGNDVPAAGCEQDQAQMTKGQEENPEEETQTGPIRLFTVPGRTIRVLVSQARES